MFENKKSTIFTTVLLCPALTRTIYTVPDLSVLDNEMICLLATQRLQELFSDRTHSLTNDRGTQESPPQPDNQSEDKSAPRRLNGLVPEHSSFAHSSPSSQDTHTRGVYVIVHAH